MKRVTKPPPAGLSFRAFSLGSRIRTESLIVVWQKEEVTFWCCIVWDYFSLLPSGQNQLPHVAS